MSSGRQHESRGSRAFSPSPSDQTWEWIGTAVLVAFATLVGLCELFYGSWATMWNLRRSPPSYGGGAVCLTIAVAVPVAAVVTWRFACARTPSRTQRLMYAAAVAGVVGGIVLVLVGVAAAMTGM